MLSVTLGGAHLFCVLREGFQLPTSAHNGLLSIQANRDVCDYVCQVARCLPESIATAPQEDMDDLV